MWRRSARTMLRSPSTMPRKKKPSPHCTRQHERKRRAMASSVSVAGTATSRQATRGRTVRAPGCVSVSTASA